MHIFAHGVNDPAMHWRLKRLALFYLNALLKALLLKICFTILKAFFQFQKPQFQKFHFFLKSHHQSCIKKFSENCIKLTMKESNKSVHHVPSCTMHAGHEKMQVSCNHCRSNFIFFTKYKTKTIFLIYDFFPTILCC